jgi:glucose/arabinose dehydrogenase
MILLFLIMVACGSVEPIPVRDRTPVPVLDTPQASSTLPAAAPTETPASVTLPNAVSFADPNNYQWQEWIPGLDNPVDIQNAGDGSGRLFIVEQPGRIRIFADGHLLEPPFLDITDRVDDSASERGLLGLAFHPDYEHNGYFYINYTETGGDTVIARYQVGTDANITDPNSEKRLLGVKQPFANHNGGAVVFGPDGYLYLGLGDGGAGGDPFGNGQKLNTLLGKILRIDVDQGDPYMVPGDNPFGSEVWHYGLRNPWRISFDRLTGDLFIADVGQGAWEEIDFDPAGQGGLNFGWNLFEGNHDYAGGSSSGITAPVAEYDHGQGCSVTGGYVYRGSLPEWLGIYFYGDYCSGYVWGLFNDGQGWQDQLLFQTGTHISTFGVDEAGELYLADLAGSVYKLAPR